MESDAIADSKIVQQDVPVDPASDNAAGVPDGTVEKESDALHEAIRDRIEHVERVVIEEDGSFHKEAVTEGQA